MDNEWLKHGNASSYAMIDGSIISLDSDETRKFREMVKENYVATNHKRKISYVESRGIWRTFVGNPRKEVTRKTKAVGEWWRVERCEERGQVEGLLLLSCC